MGVEMNVHIPKAERSNRDYDTTCNTTFTCVQFNVYFIFLCVFRLVVREIRQTVPYNPQVVSRVLLSPLIMMFGFLKK